MPEVHESRGAGSIELDDLRIDFDARRVCRGEEELAVTARSFELLRFLIEQHPRIAAAREIIAGVWPGGVVSSAALTQRVKLLRRQLGGGNERYVSTVHGIGYRLAASPRRASSPDTVRVLASAPRFDFHRHWLSRHPLLTAGLAAVVAFGVLAGAVLVYDPPHALKHALKHRLGGATSR